MHKADVCRSTSWKENATKPCLPLLNENNNNNENMQRAIYTAKFKTIIYVMWTNSFITQCFVLKDHLPISFKNPHVRRKVVKYFRHFSPSISTKIGVWPVSTFVVKTEKRQASQYSDPRFHALHADLTADHYIYISHNSRGYGTQTLYRWPALQGKQAEMKSNSYLN